MKPSPGIELPRRNFALRYETDIPRQVGLAGSSAIVTAVVRALMEFYEVSIPKELLPSLILSVETRDIGIAAGLQDRVAQVYEPDLHGFRPRLLDLQLSTHATSR